MSTRRFKVLLTWDPDDKVWVSYVPTLDWLSTFGETQEEALRYTKEAVLGYLEAAEKEELEVPESDVAAELAEVEVVTS